MSDEPHEPNAAEALRAAAAGRRRGLLFELAAFVRYQKKWWLIPIVLAVLVLAALTLLSSSPVAPFIYPLF